MTKGFHCNHKYTSFYMTITAISPNSNKKGIQTNILTMWDKLRSLNINTISIQLYNGANTIYQICLMWDKSSSLNINTAIQRGKYYVLDLLDVEQVEFAQYQYHLYRAIQLGKYHLLDLHGQSHRLSFYSIIIMRCIIFFHNKNYYIIYSKLICKV